MEADILKLNRMLQAGKCCSQVLVSMGLELKGEKNPQLEQAAAALCLGVRSGLTCGALTGAAMMLCLFDREMALGEMIPDLTEWFEETYGEIYGGSTCDAILEKNMVNKTMRCPALIENTYRKVREILEDAGFDLDEMIENLEEE